MDIVSVILGDLAPDCPGKLRKAVPYPPVCFFSRGRDAKISCPQIMVRFFPLYQLPFDEGPCEPRGGAFFHGKNGMQVCHLQSSLRRKGVKYEKLREGNPLAKDGILPAETRRLVQFGNQEKEFSIVFDRCLRHGCNIQPLFQMSSK